MINFAFELCHLYNKYIMSDTANANNKLPNQKYTNCIFSCYGGVFGAFQGIAIRVVCTIVGELERWHQLLDDIATSNEQLKNRQWQRPQL
jgi:hypothetical protein